MISINLYQCELVADFSLIQFTFHQLRFREYKENKFEITTYFPGKLETI